MYKVLKHFTYISQLSYHNLTQNSFLNATLSEVSNNYLFNLHTHTHTHKYIYMYTFKKMLCINNHWATNDMRYNLKYIN